MSESGFRAASAFVEITADLDDRQVTAAARRIVDGVDAELSSGIQRSGDEMTDTLTRSGERGGEGLVRSVEGRIRDGRGRFSKAGEQVGDGASLGFLTKFGSSIGTKLPDMLSGSMMSAAAPALVALAPTLAAGLSGAVVGGAGLGGIIGGVILASRDARVKQAGSDLGEFIIGDLEQRASGFVPVVVDALGDIRAAWVDMGPDIDRIFHSSRLVDPLVAGMTSGAKKLVGGIADAVDRADAPVRSFGMMLDAIGGSAGDLFTTMADDADEGASAINDLTSSMTNLIDTTSQVIHFAAQIKGGADSFDVWADKQRYAMEDSSLFQGVLGSLTGGIDITADGFARGSVQAEAYRAATLGTAEAADFAVLKQAGMTDAQIASADASGTFRAKLGEVNAALGIAAPAFLEVSDRTRLLNSGMSEGIEKAGGLANAFKILNGGALSAQEAEVAYQAAVDSVTASIKANGKTTDIHTEKGRANDKVLRSLISTTAAKAQATYDETLATQGADAAQAKAGRTYERGRAQLIASAQAMGMTKAEAIAYADRLMKIPKSWQTKVDLNDQASAKAKAIKASIERINGRTVVVAVKYEQHGSIQGEHLIGQGTNTKADGGPVEGGSGFRDDVPLLAMGGEWVIRKSAVRALERSFGRGIMPALNTADRRPGSTPRLPPPIRAPRPPDPSVAAIGGSARYDYSGPTATSKPEPRVFHFNAGAFSMDLSKIGSVADLMEMLENLDTSARSYRAASPAGAW